MDCGCDANGLLPIENAKKRIADLIVRVRELEQCPLNDALDRVISQDIISPINVPAYNNSAMDGYAFKFDDTKQHKSLHIIGKSFAGNAFTGELKAGECVRIMTGAQMPIGADTVIMQESTQTDDKRMSITGNVARGANIRKAGGDIEKGEIVLAKGHRIGPVDIGLLASLGIAEVPVFRKLKVAVFSTGDELLAPGENAREDRIYDSNRPMLVAMLNRLGVEVKDMGIIEDNKTSIFEAFKAANDYADCVITSGGVSVGEADYTREVLDEYGKIDFWKLAIKPGKPLAFGRLPNSFFFGLPGNPVSAAVTFDQIASDAIEIMSGCEPQHLLSFTAIAGNRFKKRPGRTDYQRVSCYKDELGRLLVSNTGTQSSGVLSCFSKSNCYAVLENERGTVEEGEALNIILFSRNIV